jgi:hypothetical protein
MRPIQALCLFLAACLSGCATAIDGAEEPPGAWMPKVPGNCTEIDGLYAVQGLPAPTNANSGLYTVVWPTTGSLDSMIEHGVNGMKLGSANTVRISIEGPASVSFSAFDDKGRAQLLAAREWQCEGSELTTRVLLSRIDPLKDSEKVEESVVRLWKSDDGALIAENSVERAKWHSDGPTTGHHAMARFYFRFVPVGAGVPR